jgi:hypothetical protein
VARFEVELCDIRLGVPVLEILQLLAAAVCLSAYLSLFANILSHFKETTPRSI